MAKTFAPLTPSSVLCVVAHADDAEAFMGGAVAKWAAEGAQVHYLVLTDGNRGVASDGSASTRQTEQQQAADLLGVASVAFAGFPDCELALTTEVKREIVRAIRTHTPDVVMCIDPSFVYSSDWGIINHIDHRIAGEATLMAVYPLACNEASFTDLQLAPHKVSTLLLAQSDEQNHLIDISPYLEKKLEALRLHGSQQQALQPVLDMVQKSAEQMGARVGARYAEGYIRVDISI